VSILEPTTDSRPLAAVARVPATARPVAARPWLALAPVADAVVLTLAVAVERVSGRSVGAETMSVAWVFGFPAITMLLLAGGGLYRERLRPHFLDDLRTIAGGAAIAAMATISVSALVADDTNLAAQGVRLWLFATVYLAASRSGVSFASAAARRDGAAGAPTLIVGAGTVGRLLAKRLVAHPEIGLRPIGFLDKEPRSHDDDDPSAPRLPVLGASWDLNDVLEQYRVERVLFTFSTAPHDVLMRMVDECTSRGVHVTLVPRLFEKMPRQFTVDHVGGISLLSIEPANPRGRGMAVKYLFDRIAAAFALMILAPVLAIIAAGVWMSLGRPVFFRQRRIGRDSEPFDMLKFRTMRGEAPSDYAGIELPPDTAPGGIEGEDRRSMLGAFLRRTSLDELPQLLNVLRGEMSLVGPRPERPDFAFRFAQDVYRYDDRHRVKAGITGWAQIHGLRGNTSLTERAEWDNFYIENASLWFDLRILLQTVIAVIRPRNAV
jgi:exopolysaccharide biosynthesis polyprenyl glycosylphosphotransferase